MFTRLRPDVSAQAIVCRWLLNLGIIWIMVGHLRSPDVVGAETDASVEVRRVQTVDDATVNSHYVGNRVPLASSPFVKLPNGSIRPSGWLRRMLELQRDGMTGRLAEISPWLDKDHSDWAGRDGSGRMGWEELAHRDGKRKLRYLMVINLLKGRSVVDTANGI